MATKKSLAEQILYKLQGGFPDIASAVDERDIIEAIGQALNTILKMQHFSVTMAAGETIPDGLMVATYEGVAVAPYGNKKAKALLPAMPISLPRNMGVLEVSPDSNFKCLYIPLMAGQSHLLQEQPLISDLLGEVGYEVYGHAIIFTKDITIDNTVTVYIRLVVMDIAKYDIYTPLPIPRDYEGAVMEEVLKMFVPVQPGEKIVDSYTERGA